MNNFFDTLRILQRYGWEKQVDDGCIMLGDHILCFADEQLVGYYNSLFRRADEIIIKRHSITIMCMGDSIVRIAKPSVPCVF